MPKEKLKSGLPAPVPGEAFSLLDTLRRCRSTLTVKDAASLLLCSEKAIYAQINEGLIPVLNLGKLKIIRIDPRAWAYILEHDNAHLLPSVKAGDKHRLKVAA